MFETTAYSHLTGGNLPDPQKMLQKGHLRPRWPEVAPRHSMGKISRAAGLWWSTLFGGEGWTTWCFCSPFYLKKDEWWVKLQGIYNRKFGTLHFLPMALITWGILRNDVFASFWALQAVMSKLCSALPFAPLFQRRPYQYQRISCVRSVNGSCNTYVMDLTFIRVKPLDLKINKLTKSLKALQNFNIVAAVSEKKHWSQIPMGCCN